MHKQRRARQTETSGKFSDEQVEARWRALTPMFLRACAASTVAAIALFLVNRLIGFGQRTTELLTVVFQITLAMAVLSGFLLLMALLFGPRQ